MDEKLTERRPFYYPFELESIERRKIAHYSFETKCVLKAATDFDNKEYHGTIRDISAGGMRIFLSQKIVNIPTYITLRVAIPDGGDIFVKGYIEVEDERVQEDGVFYRIKYDKFCDGQQTVIGNIIKRFDTPLDRRAWGHKTHLRKGINQTEYRHLQHKQKMVLPRDRRLEDRRRINQIIPFVDRRRKQIRTLERRQKEIITQFVNWEISDTLELVSERLIQFYLRANFIYRIKRDFLLPLKNEISDTIEKLVRCRNDTCKIIFIRDKQGQIQGSTMAVQYSNDAWYVQHTSTLPEQKMLTRELLLEILSWTLVNQKMKYLVTFFQEKTRFAYKTFHQWAAAMKSDHISIETHDYMVLPLDQYQFPKAIIEVRDMETSDFPYLYERLVEREKKVFLDSLGLCPGGYHLDVVKKNYQKIDLKRGRRYFVAKQNNKIIGFCFADISSYGINMSLLFNTVTLFAFNEIKKFQIYSALINRVNQVLKENNKVYSILLVRQNDREIFEKMGYRYMRSYMRLVYANVDHIFQKAYDYILTGRERHSI